MQGLATGQPVRHSTIPPSCRRGVVHPPKATPASGNCGCCHASRPRRPDANTSGMKHSSCQGDMSRQQKPGASNTAAESCELSSPARQPANAPGQTNTCRPPARTARDRIAKRTAATPATPAPHDKPGPHICCVATCTSRRAARIVHESASHRDTTHPTGTTPTTPDGSVGQHCSKGWLHITREVFLTPCSAGRLKGK
jgi:hypothetical protein